MGSTSIDWLEIDRSLYDTLHDGFSEIQLPAQLDEATWEQVLLHLVPSWHQKGTQLKRLGWPSKQVFKPEDIEKVPSWDSLGTQLLQRKVSLLITILCLACRPISTSELMRIMGYKNEKSFRDRYLKPLRDVGLIAFTIPDNPTDSNNRYVITAQGQTFLGGIDMDTTSTARDSR